MWNNIFITAYSRREIKKRLKKLLTESKVKVGRVEEQAADFYSTDIAGGG